LNDDERERVDVLITQLGASSFKDREKAGKDLIAKGPAVLAALRQGLGFPDQEVQLRCETCIQAIKNADRLAELSGPVVRLLAVRKPPGGVEVLLAYLPCLDNDAVAADVRDTLARLAFETPENAAGQKRKIHASLVAALGDKLPFRRALAGEAVVQAGAFDSHQKAIQDLLHDPSADVRSRVALALVTAKQKQAVPALIDALPDATPLLALEVEEILHRLAAGRVPPNLSLGAGHADRLEFRDAWNKWWKENGATVDLAVLGKPHEIGWTTMVLLDVGRIIEVDQRDHVRWEIDNVQYPLDVQVLPGGRVLIAEHGGDCITERNLAGQVLWQTKFTAPQVAQRLPNGNTFMASRSQMAEIDPQGNRVFTFDSSRNLGPNGGIMKCVKLPSGDITCLYTDGALVRMDSTGKELSTFHISLGHPLLGGRIQVLPNGNVLIPHFQENKVSEYNGPREVWKVRVDQPIVATRLANGNTLVTSMGRDGRDRAVEFDVKGTAEVWQYRPGTRVTRAVRR
jgi:hypothetical protein